MNGLALDPQVFQLLFSQLNLNPSEVEALQNSDYTRLLGERLAGDPALASNPLLGLLMNGLNPSAGGEAEDLDLDDAAFAPETIRSHPLDVEIDLDGPDEASSDSHEDASSEAGDDLQQAIAALQAVAEILGACACWGQDPVCPHCDGLGQPGYRTPSDPATFIRWVQPNLRRMGIRLVPFKRTHRTTITKPEE